MRWLEYDEWDRLPTKPAIVVLCGRCSSLLIDSHPRLYHELEPHAPFPGAMAICVGCGQRSGVSCMSPLAKVNGGPGVEIKYALAPTHAHVCGSRRGGGRFSEWRSVYYGPPTSCSGHVAPPPIAEGNP
jgi:hypothetical protein